MKFTIARKSYNNDVKHGGEGWVTVGQIFNVGQEHKPGLRTITEARAKDCVRLGLHQEYRDGQPVPVPSPNDPHRMRAEALQRRFELGNPHPAPSAQKKVREDGRRQTKVEPPPQTKKDGGGQAPNPPPPRRAGAGRKSEASPAAPLPQNTSTPGGQTGAAPTSVASSVAAPAAKPSTGKTRGMRRGDPAHKARNQRSASSRSTKAGDSSPAPMRSTAPTSPGGDTEKESPDSPDLS